MLNWSRIVVGTLALGVLSWTPSQGVCASDPAERPYSSGRASRDGIGKFYMGREISFVMGHRGTAWLERPERAVEEQPDRVVEAMALAPDAVVADVGAGGGYFTFRIARVLPDGYVLAVDVQSEMLEVVKRRRIEAERIVSEIVSGQTKVLKDPAPVVRLHALGESSVDFVVRPCSQSTAYWDVY